tara:strand:- start:744 stop:983 length:240 start_codon:yes stop_codon:yes gene_type:complete
MSTHDQTLDQFLSERTATEMKRIEEEIYKEVSAGICEYFGSDNVKHLSEDQIREVKVAQETRERGFLKLGYNLVLKQLR